MGLYNRIFTPDTFDINYRKPIILNNNKKPIIIFGCSYAYGSGYNYDLVGEELAKLTHRSVYNRSMGGMGPQMMLYQLKSGRIQKLVKEPEYIIYILAADAESRTVKFRNWPFLWDVGIRYKLLNDNSLKLELPNRLFVRSNIYRLIDECAPEKYGREYINKLFYRIIEESFLEIQKSYPSAKFIIFDYRPNSIIFKREFEKMGIMVISSNELTNENLQNKKYTLDDGHPNKEAWNLLLPLLIKKLKDNKIII